MKGERPSRKGIDAILRPVAHFRAFWYLTLPAGIKRTARGGAKSPTPGNIRKDRRFFCCSSHRLRKYARIAYEITILAGARTRELVQQKREPVLRRDKRQNQGSQHEDDSKISSSCSTTRAFGAVESKEARRGARAAGFLRSTCRLLIWQLIDGFKNILLDARGFGLLYGCDHCHTDT
jgi:hypothetical protein